MDVSDALHIHRPVSRSIRVFFVAVVCISVLIIAFHLYNNPSSTSSAPILGQNASSYARPTRAPQNKESGGNGYGYILELDASDQLTSGAANLLCLQCLARQIDPKVMLVEPFIANSTYGAVLLGNRDLLARENNVRLRDIYDIGEWNKFTQQHQYAELASWEDFLEEAPRDVIVVQHRWLNCSAVTSLKKRFSPFFRLFQFQVVRFVCLQFQQSGVLTLEQFKEMVYGNLSASKVTVIFDRFCGIGDRIYKFTTSLKGTPCNKSKMVEFVVSTLSPSQRAIKDATTYVQQYLGGHNDYISLMLRLELPLLTFGFADYQHAIKKCLEQVLNEWKVMKVKYGLNSTFFTLDANKFGSLGYYRKHRDVMAATTVLVKKFVQTLYGNESFFNQWENSFEEVTGLNSGGVEGYVATLQKVVAARGRCIIFVGGGSFQKSAFTLYKNFHKEHRHLFPSFSWSCYTQLDRRCDRFASNVY